jgi:starch synthase
MLSDKNQKYYKDNDERCIFFCRGVLETVKKLSWAPDIIHVHGWMGSLLPIYVKRAFKDNPIFSESKIVYSIYDDDFPGTFSKNFAEKIKLPGISKEDLALYQESNFLNITKAALAFSDAVIIGSQEINPELKKYLSTIDKPVLEYQPMESYIEAYSNFYDEVLINNSVLS